jgi:hypothetical protein
MIEDVDGHFEQAVRAAWAAAGYAPEALPPRADARMQEMLAHLREASMRLLDGELARLQRREANLEQRLAEIEERMAELEARVGLGVTLQ